eukprot:364806-Chlamydomonas_euryale.AAC.6
MVCAAATSAGRPRLRFAMCCRVWCPTCAALCARGEEQWQRSLHPWAPRGREGKGYMLGGDGRLRAHPRRGVAPSNTPAA